MSITADVIARMTRGWPHFSVKLFRMAVSMLTVGRNVALH